MVVTSPIGLNLRTGPGLGYAIILTMPYGSYVTAIRSEDGWTRVIYQGTTGWAYSALLSYEAPASAAPQEGGTSSGNNCYWAHGYLSCAPAWIAKTIRGAAARHDVSADWLIRVAACESDFNPNAVGNAGEIGIFQFLPQTFYDNGGGDIHSVYDQAEVAATMFANNLSGQWTCA